METTTVAKKGLFITNEGQNLAFTFVLVTSLFLLWGFCNGLIDVMDKHFQQGGFSATQAFIAFLAGVCLIATGLTFLETIANPYTTVLGDPRYAATRINLAQSSNGIGWIFGPIAGSMFFYSKDALGKSTGNQTLYIPYLGIAAVVIVLAAIFYFAPVPDIKTEDDYHLDDAAPGVSHSIWSHPHFVFAVAAQFFYVAAQAGIFSFFINYMTAEVPPIPPSWSDALSKFAASAGFLHDWLSGWFETAKSGALAISNKGASNLASLGFVCFLVGRFSGAGLLRKFSAHKVLGLYALLNVLATFLVFCKFGWLSVVCVFLSYFLMSIMFPTIFALGIFGLGLRAKRASAFIVMAIMGGAILPKLMGYVADKFDMSRGFIVPMFCFVLVALYGFAWPRLSKADSPQSVAFTAGH